MRLASLISIFIIASLLYTGCTNAQKAVNGPDETGMKVVVGYVNTDPFYLISIEKRVNGVLDWLRSERSVFYQPSPDELLRLSNISLKREIRKVGMRQPGMQINTGDKIKVAGEIARERANKIIARLKEGAKMEDIEKEFKIRLPVKNQKILKGENPEYDTVIWNTPIGEIAGPVESQDRIFIFRVDDRGVDSNGKQWALIYTLSIVFPEDEALKKLEDELAKNWSIRITDGFYSAIGKYFQNDIVGAKSDLTAYLGSGEGRKNPLAHYLMVQVLKEQNEKTGDAELNKKAIDEIRKAIETSKDARLKPYFIVEYGNNLRESGDAEKAKEQYRTAFDDLRNDKYLAVELLEIFKATGDTEYMEKASQKATMLEEQIKAEISGKPRKPQSKSVVMTGEGPLEEDPEEIWNEEKATE